MFDLINILAPTCMLLILFFGIFASIMAKKNERKVEIPEEYTGKENIYLQLRQHQWTMIIVYSEIFIFFIWIIANFLGQIFLIDDRCVINDCSEQIIPFISPFFLKLFVVLSSMLAALKYDKKKERTFIESTL